ncbi:MAG: penicillin-binding transpeptidase domain-containing protein [Gammaproteobacteria bacterium]|nr:penicillin-binding transpeptidase domain-containing protein [Gammaproteobacteria bacterium]
MKWNQAVIGITLSVVSLNTFAATPDFAKLFKNNNTCFMLYNNNTKKMVEEYNPARCNERVSPCSTFKVPLSVMAFDQKIITQKTVFKWDGKNKGIPQWNHNQTPQTWLKYSVVWVSQQITPQLGMRTIKYYLNKFNYGNQNFSGDPYQNNGLTHAWLHSSLKISADEQLDFLKRLADNTLPVSQDAMKNTKQNMYLETLPNGYKLYGKSGSWGDGAQQLGWFIGYIQKAKQTYIFALNFSGPDSASDKIPGGTRASNWVKKILAQTTL